MLYITGRWYGRHVWRYAVKVWGGSWAHEGENLRQVYYPLWYTPIEFWIPREERKICCLSASSPLPRLGRASKVLGCQENPCAGEFDRSISWPNTKGCFRLPPYAISNPSDCYLFLNDEKQLECDDEFGLRGVGSSAGRLIAQIIQNFMWNQCACNISSWWQHLYYQIHVFSAKCKARQVWSAGRKKCIDKF